MSYDWIVLQSSDGINTGDDRLDKNITLDESFMFSKITEITLKFIILEEFSYNNHIFMLESLNTGINSTFSLTLNNVSGRGYDVDIYICNNRYSSTITEIEDIHEIKLTIDNFTLTQVTYNGIVLQFSSEPNACPDNQKNVKGLYIGFRPALLFYTIKLVSNTAWPQDILDKYFGVQPIYQTSVATESKPPPPATPIITPAAQPTPAAQSCSDVLTSLARATTDLAIKNYQWAWSTYENLRADVFTGAKPTRSQQTYYDMNESPPTLTTTDISGLSDIYTSYTNGVNDVFYSSIRILYNDRIQSYCDLISTYATFVANKSIQAIDAENTNNTVNALAGTFPTLNDANLAKSQLKPENVYLTYNDTNAATVSTIQGNYGKDSFTFDTPIATNSPRYLEKALSTIKSELSDYIDEYNAIYNNTAPSYRPPSATEAIGIPPPNSSTNSQDLIKVMKEYMNKSLLLVRGGKQKNAQVAIDEYKKLYTDYVSYLISSDKDTVGVDSLTYKELYDQAPDVSTLDADTANSMYNRYTTAVGSTAGFGTYLNGVIVACLQALCTSALNAYKTIYEDFQPLLGYQVGPPYPPDISNSLVNVYNPTYISGQGSKTNLVNILNYYSYQTDYSNLNNPALQRMTTFLKSQLTSKLLTDISGVLTANVDILGIPLTGTQVLDSKIANLATTLTTDLSGVSAAKATATDVGNVDTTNNASLYKLAQKYLAQNGLKDLLTSEIDRLTILNTKRQLTKAKLELFYDSCYLPLKARLDYNKYTLPTITDYIRESSLTNATRTLSADMTDTFNGLGLDDLQGIINSYDLNIETIKTQITSCIKADLTVYKNLYNAYTSFANTYTSMFSAQSSDLPSSSVTVLGSLDKPSSLWNTDSNAMIVGESIDFVELEGISSAPTSAPTVASLAPVQAPVTASAVANQTTYFVNYMKNIWMSHFVKNGTQSSYMFALINAIKSKFTTFLARFDAISTAVTNQSIVIKFEDGNKAFSIALRYQQYTTDSGKLDTITSDLVDAADIEKYKNCMKYNIIFMDSTTETISGINLTKGLIPRYTTLVPMFCIDDDRRRAIASLKEYWDKYTDLRVNTIPFVTIPTGVTNMMTYFTGGALNATFNGQADDFYVARQRDYRNPDCFAQPLGYTNYFTDLKQATTAAVTSLVNLFLSDALEKYRILQSKANAWELDIADIFYTPTTTSGVYAAPQLSFAAICEGIYQTPTRYPRLVTLYANINTLWELAKYRNCIPIDLKYRPSKDVLASRFSR